MTEYKARRFRRPLNRENVSTIMDDAYYQREIERLLDRICEDDALIAEMKAERVDMIPRDEADAMVAAVIDWYDGLVGESTGVAGYHLNGEVAGWGEFDRPKCPDDARAALDKMLAEARREGMMEIARKYATRNLNYYPIEMPLTKEGMGPATIGEDAAKMTYEVWEAATLRTVSSHEYLSDAMAAAIRAEAGD